MSEHGSDLFEEKEKVVVIGNEDVKNIRDFFTHFKIEMTAELSAALDAFEADRSHANQDEIRFRLSENMKDSTHPLLKDELFKQVIDNSTVIAEEFKFNRLVEETLAKEEDKEC
jgi:hypothetical protein